MRKLPKLNKIWAPQNQDLLLGRKILILKKQGNSKIVLRSKRLEGSVKRQLAEGAKAVREVDASSLGSRSLVISKQSGRDSKKCQSVAACCEGSQSEQRVMGGGMGRTGRARQGVRDPTKSTGVGGQAAAQAEKTRTWAPLPHPKTLHPSSAVGYLT